MESGSTRRQAPDFGYGYQWWIDRLDVGGAVYSGYSARGRTGQFIFVLPDLESLDADARYARRIRVQRGDEREALIAVAAIDRIEAERNYHCS